MTDLEVQLWAPALRRFIDPANERQIVIPVAKLGFYDRTNVVVGITLVIIGSIALSGIGGITGLMRFGAGSLFAAAGALWTRWALADRRRWFSLELRSESWHIKSGLGGHVDRAIAISIKGASTRIVADERGGDGWNDHLIIEDLTVRKEQPLPQIELGEAFCLPVEVLEAIGRVVSEQATLRAGESRNELNPARAAT